MKKLKQIFILIFTVIMCYQIAPSIYRSDQVDYSNLSSNDIQPQNKVVIGVVYCRNPKTDILKHEYLDQTIILLKSVLISAHRYNIPTIEIHLFLEHVKEDQTYFQNEILQKMAVPGVTVNLQIYSAVDTVPQKYRPHMVYHPRYRCGYVRFFFPEALPNVDSIIHLDSDMIVTGDLTKHWKMLSKMNDYQMVAMTQDTPSNNNKSWPIYNYFFGPTPHVKPRGVNAGLLVMNLTRMRKLRMSEKLTRIYDDYSKFTKVLSGQRVFNILLYFISDMLLLIPCNLHFMGPECEDDKFYCETALKDPEGIHLVHGTCQRFMKDKVFHPIYKFYKEFDISTIQNSTNLEVNLMEPIKQAYSNKYGNDTTKCSGTLDKVLFKHVM